MTARPSGFDVLSVIDSLGQGGAERSLIDIAANLGDHGIATTIATRRRVDHGYSGVVRETGMPVEVIGTGRLEGPMSVRRILRERGFDVVHTTLVQSNLAGRLGAIGTGTPVLTSLVNMTYDPVRLEDPRVSANGLRLYRLVDGWTARHLTTHFHALTRAVADRAMLDLGIRGDSITVVPRGRDPEEFHPARDATEKNSVLGRIGLHDETPVLINVGRHEYQKGQRILLEALPRVVERHPKVVLLVLGREGNETSNLEQLVEGLSLASHVRFLGDRRDVAEILRAADLFVFPSLYEGFGGSVIEAMATNLPIVASDLAPLREVLASTGTLVPRSRPDLLADAVLAMLDDRDRALDLAEQAYGRFEERFRLDRVVDQMAELIKTTVTRG